MATLFANPLVLCLISLLSVADSLRCHHCSTIADKRCNYDPSYSSIRCASSAIGCFSRMVDTGDMHRSCAVPTNTHWKACEEQSSMGCFFCKTDNCNAQTLYRNGTQKCVVCTGNECLTKTELTTCTKTVYYSNPEFCYYAMLNHTVTAKGCGHIGPKNHAVTVCQGQGCNMELPLTYSTCYDFHGGYQGYWRRNRTSCHTKLSNYWHPGCYYVPPWKDRYIQSGCLSQMDPIRLKMCTSTDFKLHCQYCVGDECNKLELKRFNYTNRCQAPANSEEYCSQLESRCYVSQLLISAGRNETMLQKYAGCVEPGLNAFLLVSPQTHFCDNFGSDEVPCMPIDQDFSKRLSCFRCWQCEDVFEMDHRIKHLCPVGTTQCYSVMGRDKRVRRGCVHPTDKLGLTCDMYSHVDMCAKCDYNYCNFHGVANSPALCYKTRPFLHKSHLMTMRLEDCMGFGLVKVWPDCYVAQTGNTFIEAGCVNELEAAEIVRYKHMNRGDISIVHRKTLSCYKCVSNQTDFCYNVRHLQPSACRGQSQYAIRGCYTLLQKYSIQRGCLTELDLYRQKMCSTVNFEEVCIVCRNSFCNIHMP